MNPVSLPPRFRAYALFEAANFLWPGTSFLFRLPAQKRLQIGPPTGHPRVTVAVLAGGQLRIYFQVGQLRHLRPDDKSPPLAFQPV